MQNKQEISLREEEATYMAVEKRASVSGQTVRLLERLNRHFNLIIDVIKKKGSRQDSNKKALQRISDQNFKSSVFFFIDD